MTDQVTKAAETLLADLASALSNEARSEKSRDAAKRWAGVSDAAEAAPTVLSRPTPIQMIRAGLEYIREWREQQGRPLP